MKFTRRDYITAITILLFIMLFGFAALQYQTCGMCEEEVLRHNVSWAILFITVALIIFCAIKLTKTPKSPPKPPRPTKPRRKS